MVNPVGFRPTTPMSGVSGAAPVTTTPAMPATSPSVRRASTSSVSSNTRKDILTSQGSRPSSRASVRAAQGGVSSHSSRSILFEPTPERNSLFGSMHGSGGTERQPGEMSDLRKQLLPARRFTAGEKGKGKATSPAPTTSGAVGVDTFGTDLGTNRARAPSVSTQAMSETDGAELVRMTGVTVIPNHVDERTTLANIATSAEKLAGLYQKQAELGATASTPSSAKAGLASAKAEYERLNNGYMQVGGNEVKADQNNAAQMKQLEAQRESKKKLISSYETLDKLSRGVMQQDGKEVKVDMNNVDQMVALAAAIDKQQELIADLEKAPITALKKEIGLEICTTTFGLEGAAVRLLADRANARGVEKKPLDLSYEGIAKVVQEAVTTSGKEVTGAAYPKLFENGPNNQPWKAGRQGELDRASATFDALNKTLAHLESAQAQGGDHYVEIENIKLSRLALKASVEKIDAGLQASLQNIADKENIKLPVAAYDGRAEGMSQALAEALSKLKADPAKSGDRDRKKMAVARLGETASAAAAVYSRIASEEIKAEHIESNAATRTWSGTARTMVGSVVPAAISASVHSTCANFAGEHLGKAFKTDPLDPAGNFGKGFVAPGIGLGTAIPGQNQLVAPGMTSGLEFLGAYTLKPTDSKVVYPDAPRFVVGDDMAPKKVDDASYQAMQKEVDDKRENFDKETKEYSYAGTTGKNIGYASYSLGNGLRTLIGGESITAKVTQTGVSQAIASAAMTGLQMQQTIDGWPAFTLQKATVTRKGLQGTNSAFTESNQWTRMKNGFAAVNPLERDAREQFVVSVVASIQAIAAGNLIGLGVDELLNNSSEKSNLKSAASVAAGFSSLLQSIFRNTEQAFKKERERAHKAGISSPDNPYGNTRIALNTANPYNVNAEHQSHVYPRAQIVLGQNVFARMAAKTANGARDLFVTAHAIGSNLTAIAPNMAADLVENVVIQPSIGAVKGIVNSVTGASDPKVKTD